ncbi:APHP domain-containing protein [Methanolobus psychrophilus R15]|nr:APHP domain-containing protein [Methanolobus psychrophilus R15]
MVNTKLLKTKYASVAVTVTIVLMLILSGPATALNMGISINNTTPAQGEEITFTVTANITGIDKYVPMQNFSLALSKDGSVVRNVVFSPSGTILSGGSDVNIDPIEVPSSSDYGYGNGTALDDQYGYGYGYAYAFGYGYGYAANNGAGGDTRVYEYNVTINTSSFDTGEYSAQVLMNTGSTAKPNFSSISTDFTVEPKPADISDYVGPDGTVNTTFSITSASGNVTLIVANGTVAKNSEGNALNTSITLGTTGANSTMTLALSGSESVVGKVVKLGPAGATFDPYIQVRFDYDDADVSGLDESTLGVKFYNASSGLWESQTVVERNTAENYIIANIEHFSDFAVVGTELTTPTDDSSSSSGRSSGGGGSGGASGEKYENILVKDTQGIYIDKNTLINYEFSKPGNAIGFVQFTALKNAGRITATIEILRDRSSYAETDAPGKIYQQMNIWIGKLGFDSPENVKDLKIGFKVEKAWIEENGVETGTIKLYRYADGAWNALPTSIIVDDGEYVHFESQTPGFSPFAITAESKASGETIDETTPVGDSRVEFGNETYEPGKKGLPGFEALLLIFVGVIVAAFYLHKRKREE